MKEEKIEIIGNDNFKISAVLWLPEGAPRAILQITHGMTEHIYRYKDFAKELTAQGITVAGFDLRGHGTNLNENGCASFGKNGWEGSLNDMHLLHDYLENRFPNCPYFMMGFSLGSFLLREYLNIYDDKLAGAAILGTGYQPGVILTLMMAIVKSQIKKCGFDNTTPLVKKLSFETYNSKFTPNRTEFDWLCSDDAELDTYIQDSLCSDSISAGLFWQLLGSMKHTGNRSAYKKWDKKMPVLFLSGEKDPVGNDGKGVKKVKQTMNNVGIRNVSMHLFPNVRHDILHEEKSGCAKQVRKILINWMLNE